MRLSDLTQVVESAPIPSHSDILSKVQAFENGPIIQKMKAYVSRILDRIELEMDQDGFLQPVFHDGVTIDYDTFYSSDEPNRGLNGMDEVDEVIQYAQHEKIQLIVGTHSCETPDDFYSPLPEKLCVIRKNPSGEGLLISFDGSSAPVQTDHDLQSFLDAVDNTIVGHAEFPDISWKGPDPDDPTDDGDNAPTKKKEMYLALAYKHISHD